VQVLRVKRWEGLYLFWKLAQYDFIELRNVLDREIRDVILKLERLGDKTQWRFEREYRYKGWF